MLRMLWPWQLSNQLAKQLTPSRSACVLLIADQPFCSMASSSAKFVCWGEQG